MNIDKIMAYDWEGMIKAIVEGLKNFIDMVNKYLPKAKYNFEDPAEYEF